MCHLGKPIYYYPTLIVPFCVWQISYEIHGYLFPWLVGYWKWDELAIFLMSNCLVSLASIVRANVVSYTVFHVSPVVVVLH